MADCSRITRRTASAIFAATHPRGFQVAASPSSIPTLTKDAPGAESDRNIECAFTYRFQINTSSTFCSAAMILRNNSASGNLSAS